MDKPHGIREVSDERLVYLQSMAARSARAYNTRSEQGQEHADIAAALAELIAARTALTPKEPT